MSTQPPAQADRSFNRSMLIKLFIVALMMFGFGFALVPMYRAICQITGINNLVQRDATVREAKNTQVDMSRTISIEFDANARGPLGFKPEQRSLDVHPGEVTTVMYEVSNEQARTIQAQAIPSYAPKQATEYFKKIECFCFTQQTLTANQTKRMPVVFVVDPKLPKDVKTEYAGSGDGRRRGAHGQCGGNHRQPRLTARVAGEGRRNNMTDNGGSPRKSSFGQSMRAVLWSFFGVRKRRDLEADATQLNPLHVIAAALICAAIFIVLLILVVRAVVG
jgi:cytochrome c oxidase assembly protein subunit 11